MGNSASNLPALQTVTSFETTKFMGTWFVIAVKPTMFEKQSSNAVEKYTLLDEKTKGHDIDIDFQYNDGAPQSSKLKSMPQKGWIQGENRLASADWKVSPFWPIKMPYSIIELDQKDYSYCVIGYPSREYCWIMARTPTMDETTYKSITDKLVKNHQYTLDGLRKVPQEWSSKEREVRGLSKDDLPDRYLN